MKTLKFRSAWDWSTWAIIGFVVAVCGVDLLIACDATMIIIHVIIVATVIGLMLTTYYEITDDTLVVHYLFKRHEFPIAKIISVAPTKSALSAPALSLTKRIAIKFADSRTSLPLIISPSNRSLFISTLTALNPTISVAD